jgi:hypothetical protein
MARRGPDGPVASAGGRRGSSCLAALGLNETVRSHSSEQAKRVGLASVRVRRQVRRGAGQARATEVHQSYTVMSQTPKMAMTMRSAARIHT